MPISLWVWSGMYNLTTTSTAYAPLRNMPIVFIALVDDDFLRKVAAEALSRLLSSTLRPVV